MERIDFTFTNVTADKTTFELFNSFTSWAYQINKDARNNRTANLNLIPFPVYPPPLDTVKLKGNIIFDEYGTLYVLENTNGNIAVSIQCETYPYRALLKALETTKIMIKRILIVTSSNPLQLEAPIIRFETKPITNDYKEEYFNVTLAPTNVQPLINEFKKDILIDGKSGLFYVIYPNEVVKWTIEFEFI